MCSFYSNKDFKATLDKLSHIMELPTDLSEKQPLNVHVQASQEMINS